MALDTVHNVEKGISRLYCAPTDCAPADSLGKPTSREDASPAHQELYREYVVALKTAYPIAENWWSGILDAQVEKTGQPRDVVIEAAFLERIAGPASDLQFLAVVRDFWLRCAAINANLDEKNRVPPQDLLLGWLVEDDHKDFVLLVTCLPYWPIGLDENGNWC